jgi:hypothetical protein
MVRPSLSEAMISSSVTRTAVMSGSGWTAVLVPGMGHDLQVFLNEAPNSIEFSRREAPVRGEGQRSEPEFAGRVVALHVNMHRLHTIEAVEEEPVRTGNTGD